ncbi:hypothetical protein AWC30_15800 [Mycolicibacillus trivialis]|uniref:DUF3068 domain-containing protein n=2 Tax=Mycolicibacillus trivialis TaxID=1798 RepID=A0A1X2EGU7_9MYCO|nr:hypothetical protein AWC30_15800 [Mycolicibacillus trivialis]
MLRITVYGALGLGAALLIAALLLPTYTVSQITKIPLDIDTTLVSEGRGTALDPASLAGEHFVIDEDVPLVSQKQISVESPANADVVTLQVGSTVRRTDKQKDSGLLLAMVDTVTVNRETAEAVSDDNHPGGTVQQPRSIEDDNPPKPLPLAHEGLAYRFPFHTEKKSYPYFDPIAQEAFDANYEGEDDVNGLTAFRFTQNVGYNSEGKLVKPIKYPSLYSDNEDGEVTTTAAQWGVEGEPDEEITMTRYYAAQRTLWVDPVSGTIVKAKERAQHYYARDPLKPEATLADYTVTSTEQTIEEQVGIARDQRDWLALWSRILPITLAASGLIALVGGVLLATFAVRSEAALVDPGLDTTEQGFFEGLFDSLLNRRAKAEEPMPAAEAATEKLPTRPPDPPAAPGSAEPPPRG